MKIAGIVGCLNAAYYESSSTTDNGLLVGSWGKRTQIVHTEDVDLLFVLPYATYLQFSAYAANGQSALLQEVKAVLGDRYTSTRMRGDGQVVVIAFNTITVEVIPAFVTGNGQYLICDTHDGGSFKTTDPAAQLQALNVSDVLRNQNARRLVRMMKAWKYYCGVDIKSFQIEVLVTEFLDASPWSDQTFFYYDWLVRDFLQFLHGKANGWIFVPGTYEMVALGDGWLPATVRAYNAAARACDHERDDQFLEAGLEWQKLFGQTIEAVL